MATAQQALQPVWDVQLRESLDASDNAAKGLLDGLAEEQLNWQPAPGCWSVGQCLEHLCITNEAYLPAIVEALREKPDGPVEQIVPGRFGGWFLRNFIEPSPHGKRAPAPPKIRPAARVKLSVLDRFLSGNQACREVILKAKSKDVTVFASGILWSKGFDSRSARDSRLLPDMNGGICCKPSASGTPRASRQLESVRERSIGRIREGSLSQSGRQKSIFGILKKERFVMPEQMIWFFLSIAFSLSAWGVVTARYIWPELRFRQRADALRPLLVLHSFRFIGLAFLVPGVVSPDLPPAFAHYAAYGDIIAAALALLSLLLLPSAAGFAVAWIFSLWGTVDLLNAFYQANHAGLLAGQLGAAFFLPTLIVPLLLITHVLAFRILLQHQPEPALQESRHLA